ncbi:MAG: phosphodiester glycosidase family protein [Chthoniobacteraceae bacterium]
MNCFVAATALVFGILLSSLKAEETRYRTFTADPAEVHVFWLDPAGKRFGQLSQLQRFLTSKSLEVKMLVNGGIFEPGGIPSGLLIADGKVAHPINLADGRGNFFLKPNGIVYVDESGSHISSTAAYVAASPSPRVAIQSGPLLLAKGQIHQTFRPASSSRLHRNGVGVLPGGKLLFAITEFGQPHYPNLYEFAEFFRQHGCRDALFLDGDLSQMETAPINKLAPGNFFGSLIAVIGKPKTSGGDP